MNHSTKMKYLIKIQMIIYNSINTIDDNTNSGNLSSEDNILLKDM